MAEIGKNIIENLTSAMYENSFTVYREYIQNSADSIDKAISIGLLNKGSAYIDIEIEPSKRRVSIYDNACGIPKNQFYKILSDIADSQKDRTKEKGFRGIGRLAGIAYCKNLVFKSSVVGEETISIMTWDGDLLREILSDNSQHPSASDLVDQLITCTEEPCNKNEHFFEVIMDNIILESDNLLDEHEVIKYLQSVAPIPYTNSFVFRSKIYSFAEENNFSIDEYKVSINGNPLYKPYKANIYEGNSDNKKLLDEIKDIQFEIFKSGSGEILGWLWYGVSRFEKQIPIINEMRGIRIRKGNIQIGNGETLSYPKFYKEPRGNFYFFGELFAIHTDLIPNARRDYFNTNSTLKDFEDAIYPLLHDELYNLYHYANKVKTSTKKVVDYETKKIAFENKVHSSGFVSKDDEEKEGRELKQAKEKAEKARHELELRKKDTKNSKLLARVFEEISATYKTVEKTDDANDYETQCEKEKSKNQKYLAQSLSRYSKKEQKLIGNIYNIIKKILPQDTAELVIKKIQEELK